MMWKFFYFCSSLALAQDEVDLSAVSSEKTYPYYDPFVRQPLYLIVPAIAFLFLAFHLLKSNKRKASSGRKPDIFFYPETEKFHEKQK